MWDWDSCPDRLHNSFTDTASRASIGAFFIVRHINQARLLMYMWLEQLLSS